MRKRYVLPAVITAAIITLALTGCGAKGGTLTLVNESTHTLNRAYISLGESTVEKLYPGQWMKASVDKNVSANVKFSVGGITNDGKDMVEMSNNAGTGNWALGRCTSGLIAVNHGDGVVVTVRDNQQP